MNFALNHNLPCLPAHGGFNYEFCIKPQSALSTRGGFNYEFCIKPQSALSTHGGFNYEFAFNHNLPCLRTEDLIMNLHSTTICLVYLATED